MRLSSISRTDKQYGYGINQKKYSKEEVLKLINIRYAMSLNSFQKYIATTIAEDVCDETVADVMENLDTLQGVNVEEEALRRYADSKCFANIIGYTGQISVEEYDALSKEDQKNLTTRMIPLVNPGLSRQWNLYLKEKKEK